jgi:putrescine aminotransferase
MALYENTDILKTSSETLAPYFASRLQELNEHAIVGQVRCKGLLAAVELVGDKQARTRLAPNSAAAVFCRDQAIGAGLMVRQTGDAMIMSPPYVTELSEVDQLINTLSMALDQTAKEFGVSG